MGVRLVVGGADAEDSVRGDGGGGPGQQAPEGVRAMAGQFYVVGDLAEAGLAAVAPLGDRLQRIEGMASRCFLSGGTRTAVPRAAWPAAKPRPEKPLSASRPRGGGPASSRSAATSRSLRAAGTMD